MMSLSFRMSRKHQVHQEKNVVLGSKSLVDHSFSAYQRGVLG